MQEVTRILAAIERGDCSAAEELMPLVYDDLRRLAAEKLAQERHGQTLQATALVHEAYLRLVDVQRAQQWNGRGHFFAAVAEAMRRILVEKARRKRRAKHGGGQRRLDFDEAAPVDPGRNEDLLALDEALSRLAAEDAKKADVVKLRYFGGFSIEETADLLGISRATAKRYWSYARAWLYMEIAGGTPPKADQ